MKIPIARASGLRRYSVSTPAMANLDFKKKEVTVRTPRRGRIKQIVVNGDQ